LRIDPDYAKAHNNLGLAYFLLNDRSSALEEYKILKELDTELANLLFNFIYK
jgi:lipoprotein NlpI